MNKGKAWNVSPYLEISGITPLKYAVIILNRPLTHNKDNLLYLWRNATVTITVDGGTLSWHNFISNVDEEHTKTLQPPVLITGDFDSVSEETLEIYRLKGSKIIHTPDQDLTDFTKALLELNSYCRENDIALDSTIAVCESSGRIDQIMANLNTLFLCQSKQLLDINCPVYLMSNDSMSWLLPSGKNVIDVPPPSLRDVQNTWCSLVPVGEVCENVTTSGLKWNLENSSMKFGSLVSTSNNFDGSAEVHVSNSHTLLWSMSL